MGLILEWRATPACAVKDFIFSLLLGAGIGSVYAILAVGLVVAYLGSGVINFAQGAIAMYAARTFSGLRLLDAEAADAFSNWRSTYLDSLSRE